jgi:hypothetical protein
MAHPVRVERDPDRAVACHSLDDCGARSPLSITFNRVVELHRLAGFFDVQLTRQDPADAGALDPSLFPSRDVEALPDEPRLIGELLILIERMDVPTPLVTLASNRKMMLSSNA